MGWRDREYNRGSEAAREFFSNPASILSFALPLGRWFGARVTLHFWMLLSFLFILIGSAQLYGPGNGFIIGLMSCGLITLSAVMHEFGHRFFAQRMGGNHEEFVLWPFGGMSQPRVPPGAKPLFLANIAGIAVNALLCLLSAGVFFALTGKSPFFWIGLLGPTPLSWITFAFGWPNLTISLTNPLVQIFIINLGMLVVNLLPYAWFDGANIWQSLLWPMTGLTRSIKIVCIAGMVIAVPMFFLSLWSLDIFGLLLWVLLFSSSYVRFQTLKAAGPEALAEGMEYSEYESSSRPRKHRKGGWWAKAAAKKAAKEQAEQAKIDAILAKVHDKGLHSLTWWEKRTLKKATERQRQRDLAERL